MKSKKLGIMGGTFDPVHLGHLQTAKFIYEHLGLEKIIFVPAFIAPHKVGLEFAPAADRYRMTELATEPYPYFEVTDIELQRSGVSYTYDTVMELKARYPEYELYFIIGADAVAEYAMDIIIKSHPELDASPEAVKKYVRYGSSPRGAQAIIRTARINALSKGRYNVAYEDIKDVAYDVLRHRVFLNFEALSDGVKVEDIIDELLKEEI